jgi:hypothetical protein
MRAVYLSREMKKKVEQLDRAPVTLRAGLAL